MWPRQHGGVG
uniref:Uncharacterized protein n=1 Tax=Arundo donax TaxID=35708 RepID=A0A0A9ETU3_ARUDO